MFLWEETTFGGGGSLKGWREGGGEEMICADSMCWGLFRSLVYVEGDCSMNKFPGKDGSTQSALSIVQRE